MDCVRRGDCIVRKLDRKWLAGLRIGFIERCAGACDSHTDAVPDVKDLAHPTQGKGYLMHFVRFHKDFFLESFPVTQSPWIVNDQNRAAIRIDVADPNDDIGIASR